MSLDNPSQIQLPRLSRRRRAQTVVRLALAMLVLGFLWRVTRFAVCFPLWGDEAFVAASLYSRGFADMFGPLEYSQVAPLGFMWAELAASRTLGFSEWALRTPAFLCGLSSLVLFWLFAKRVLDKRSALLALAVFAASSYIVRHSNEVKPYSSDLAVSLLITYLGWAVYRRNTITLWIALTVATAMGVWMSYPAVFVAGAVAMLLALRMCRQWYRQNSATHPREELAVEPARNSDRDSVQYQQHPHKPFPRRRADQRLAKTVVLWIAYTTAFCGSFLAMYMFSSMSQGESIVSMTGAWQETFPPVDKPWLFPWWFLKTHTGNLLAYPIGGKNFGSTLTFLLVIAGIVALWRSKRRDLLLLLLGPLLLTFVAAAMKKYPYGGSARISLYMAPAFCLLTGVGLVWVLRYWLSRKRPMLGLYIATGLLAAIPLGGAVHDIMVPTKEHSDWNNRQAMEELSTLSRPEDQWVIFNSLKPVPYAPDIHSSGGWGARFRYYVARFAPGQVRWAPPVNQSRKKDTGKTWLIAYRGKRVSFPQQQLEAYLQTLQKSLGQPRKYYFKLTSPKDRPSKYIEAIEVYEFPPTFYE